MKRVKKTIPKIKEIIIKQYEMQCPHCHTYLQGGFNKNTLRYLCTYCNNPIEIEWDKSIKIQNLNL